MKSPVPALIGVSLTQGADDPEVAGESHGASIGAMRLLGEPWRARAY